jgi:hypothetical protein
VGCSEENVVGPPQQSLQGIMIHNQTATKTSSKNEIEKNNDHHGISELKQTANDKR